MRVAVIPSSETQGLLAGTMRYFREKVYFKSWRAGLQLLKELGICLNSEKEDNLVRSTQIFEFFFLGISVPFDFHPEISRVFGWMLRFSEIEQFPDFLELFLENFHTICSRFENWPNGKRPLFYM